MWLIKPALVLGGGGHVQQGTGQDIIQHMKPGTEGLFVAVQDTLKLQMSVSNAAYHHVSEDGATTILECVSALVDGLDLLVVLMLMSV